MSLAPTITIPERWPVPLKYRSHTLPHRIGLRFDLSSLLARDIDREMVLGHVVLDRQIQLRLRS